MTKSFLPDYSQMQIGSKHRPLFRLFAGEGWKFVRKDGRPLEFDTSIQAIEAAKECVRAILNPPIRAEQTAPVEIELDLRIEEWRRQREEQALQERQRVFGTDGPSMIFPGRGRPAVAVEHRKARRA